MDAIVDPVIVINTIFSLIIFVISIAAYRKSRHSTALYLAIGFGLFAISHILEILGLGVSAVYFLAVVQIVAYLSIATAVYRLWESEKQGFFSRLFHRR